MQQLTNKAPRFFFVIVVIITSLACSLAGKTNQQNHPDNPVAVSPDSVDTAGQVMPVQVWRSPILWMPKPDTFHAFANIPLVNAFSYNNEEVSNLYDDSQATVEVLNRAGRMISFGYEWRIEFCEEAMATDVYDGAVSLVLYESPEGAQDGFDYFRNRDELDSTIELQTGLGVGETSTFFFSEFTDCDVPGLSFEINFRRANINGRAALFSIGDLSKNELQLKALEVAQELDRLIQLEIQSNPASAGAQFVMSETENLLVWRNPSEWMPAPETFKIFSDTRFKGEEAYRNEDIANESDNAPKTLGDLNRIGRVISYGYVWADLCSEPKGILLPYGRLTLVLYDNPTGVQEALTDVKDELTKDPNLVSQKDVAVGENGFITLRTGESCGTPARFVRLNFQRYNLRAYITFATTHSVSSVTDAELTEYALKIGRDLDQIIQNEADAHPGTFSAIQTVRAYAPTLEMPFPSTITTGNDPLPPVNNNDYVDDGVSDGCVDLSTSDAVGPCYYYSIPPAP